MVFLILGMLGPFMHTTIENKNFLALHIVFEFISILFSFSIFTLVFYTYKENSNSRSILLAFIFLTIGTIDTFHTLYYKGMPEFFTPSCAFKATAFWVISRLIMSAGFLLAVIISGDKPFRISRWFVPVMSLLVSAAVFYLVVFRRDLVPEFYIEGQGLTPLKIYAEYAIISLQVITAALSIHEYSRTGNRSPIIFATALIISIFSELCFTLYISVYDLYNFMGHIYKIISYSVMFNVLFIQNVRLPYQKLKEADLILKNHAKTLEREVSRARDQIFDTNKKLYRDIEYAREIQQSMLPEKKLDFGEVEFFSSLIPNQMLSGDFYNVFEIDDNNIGVYVVDVSGHGISSAIMTIFADRTILTNKLDPYKQQLLLSPAQVLNDLFSLYNSSNFPAEMYMLMFYGVFNRITGEFTYSSAGLNTQPLYISGPEITALECDSAFPICKMGKFIQPSFKNSILKLNPGDRIFIYSDGLTEAVNREEMPFTEERLMGILRRNHTLSAEELFYEIFDRFTCFVLDKKLEDDVTLMLIQC
ncbi:MAG: MASE3 domain-containing protein [Bacillota bacterium]|nr:MASE3 domain-containing protein [Bacillota bacterium]